LQGRGGEWYELREFSRNTLEVCLWSAALWGQRDLEFVALELESELEWESSGGYWVSGEKL
jgi:hypothetical protein